MTVKELLDVVAFDREIFIKPSGRRTYYEGTVKCVPKALYGATVVELVPQIYKNDPNEDRRFYYGWGVWVENISEFDALYDGMENYETFSGEEIDSAYVNMMGMKESWLRNLKENAENRLIPKDFLEENQK